MAERHIAIDVTRARTVQLKQSVQDTLCDNASRNSQDFARGRKPTGS